MKYQNWVFIVVLFAFQQLCAQFSTSKLPISEILSSAYSCKLISYSYDENFPNLIGESYVIKNGLKGNDTIYTIKRAFDMYKGYPLYTFISNDGRKIAYFRGITNYPNYRKYSISQDEESKEITFYLDGKFVKGYTKEEFLNCDRQSEDCKLFFENNNVLNFETSTFKFYKKELSDEEIFAAENSIINVNDIIYIIDSRKRVTKYDLNTNRIIANNLDLSSVYPTIRVYRKKESNITYYDKPHVSTFDLVDSKSEKKLSTIIEEIYKYKYVPFQSESKYALHKFIIDGYLYKNGKFQVLYIKADEVFDKQKIIDYIENTKFKTQIIPSETNKIFLQQSYYSGLYSFDEKIAEADTKKAKLEKYKKYIDNLKKDSIDGFYIPKSMYECMQELDKVTSFKDKEVLRKAKGSVLFNGHGAGLGVWIRNNWINDSSRLLKYFNDRGIGNDVMGNEDISQIIIDEYMKWLNGDKSSSKEWDKKNRKKQETNYKALYERYFGSVD